MNIISRRVVFIPIALFLGGCLNKKIQPEKPIVAMAQLIDIHQGICTDTPITQQTQDETATIEKDRQELLAAQRKSLTYFFEAYCKKSRSQPEKIKKKLLQLSKQFDWSEIHRDYFSLLSWHLEQFAQVNNQTAILKKNMQKTLSALAKVEQQLLIRDFQKEDGVEQNQPEKPKLGKGALNKEVGFGKKELTDKKELADRKKTSGKNKALNKKQSGEDRYFP
ncbi:hypothetical protein [Aliikangiella coralliicola]|uniref:Lipoprotein n=1 Tax=Aliikangiella coralliicola TaxID=2592383 RepID=A0A545UGZ2_9GAMM|nr:hypothetical protein [Aliikangiella coralliicola]TQV88730.1 hypothetical protein FLL46_04150 [Aliikangiella coralliicola]